MHAVQETSINAYFSLENKKTQFSAMRKVYEDKGDVTDKEMQFFVGIPANTVSARRNDMEDVEKSLVRKCGVTGRNVIAWRLKGEFRTLSFNF